MPNHVPNGGPRSWSLERDDDGHRTYKGTWRVEVADATCGPASALADTPDLPQVGDAWVLGSEFDPWAWCRPACTVTPVLTDGGNQHFDVEFTFSTRPASVDRSGDAPGGSPSGVTDPLLEPQQVSGSMTKYQEEAAFDRYGVPIRNSSHEFIRGPSNTWDAGRAQIKISQNVPLLQLDAVTAMVDTVNAYPLWGVIARGVKLSDFTWEKKYHNNWEYYYVRHFVFDVNTRFEWDQSLGYAAVRSGWDRSILDEGTKVLNGHWDKDTGEWVVDPVGWTFAGGFVAADEDNPAHFIRFQDQNGNNARVILDGHGRPITRDSGTGTTGFAGHRYVEKYFESDFTLLGIPVIF